MWILFAAGSVLNDGRLTDLGKDFKSVITIKKLFILPAEGKRRSFLSLKIFD